MGVFVVMLVRDRDVMYVAIVMLVRDRHVKGVSIVMSFIDYRDALDIFGRLVDLVRCRAAVRSAGDEAENQQGEEDQNRCRCFYSHCWFPFSP